MYIQMNPKTEISLGFEVGTMVRENFCLETPEV